VIAFAVLPNIDRDYCWHFSNIWISCEKMNASSFLASTTFGA